MRPALRPAAPPLPEGDDEIIVTGTAVPQRRFDAGLAITTVTLDRMHEIAPNNTADLLKLAPGIWAETTGGATGANVFVRGFPTTGDSPFLSVHIDGAPIFPPTELVFSENTTLFRIDDMIERAEILRGGTSPIFANGQPGAVLNFIQRTGTAAPAGGLRLTETDYGSVRIDLYHSGPLGPDTVFALGGFHRTSQGLRNTQFIADVGGQISANVTHRFATGSVMAYARYTSDRNAFYTGVPLLAKGGGRFAALPGFDPLEDTLIGADTRRLGIDTGFGRLLPVDLQQGRGLDLIVAGATFDWTPAPALTLTNRFNLTDGHADTVGLFTGPVPTTLDRYLDDLVARANADPRVVAAAGRATAATAILAASGQPLDGDRYVLTAGLWSVSKRITALTDELRLSAALGPHALAGGIYLAHYRSADTRYVGNNLLLTATDNARRIDVRLDNGVVATRDGFVSATTGQTVGKSGGTNIALFVHDRWTLSPATTVDAGLRVEHQRIGGRVRDVLAGQDFDGNPLTLYDNNGARLLMTSNYAGNKAVRVSWAAGIVHKTIADRLILHARLSHGSNLQSFDKLRVGGPRHESADAFEAGINAATGSLRASVNAFVNRFTGLQFSRFVASSDGSVDTIVLVGGAHAVGVEVDAEIAAAPRVTLGLRGTYEDGRYHGFGANSGNRVVRQPNLQFAVTPAYSVRAGAAAIKLRATYAYVGKRYSDVENLQPLPAYATVDAGLHVDFDDGLYADVVVQNLFNQFGLTEGNTRALGAVLQFGAIIARPLFGRNLSVSIGYRF
ncbi:TonB-dependent receptor [Sphingomonas sanxanigenens]|uniref:TonB-denpendent receptor n=1 Tax=Sphingomonas sanxanigenens DSM 19645 = NX02 TaxID=1123269 RepID=W0AFI9_9SPHN|nr:TonB-dependent receptor [Sphingomonas sanxanigenens]AHE55307.1 hypothetical protein NX02_18190 [Sphingomonas sanxanigenens DSM 19645 = NX02]